MKYESLSDLRDHLQLQYSACVQTEPANWGEQILAIEPWGTNRTWRQMIARVIRAGSGLVLRQRQVGGVR